jgi:KaiC/GvpD/RAD55 family RecA-like ATPase
MSVYDDGHSYCWSGHGNINIRRGGKMTTNKQQARVSFFENPITREVSLAKRYIGNDVVQEYGVGADARGSIHFPYFDVHTGHLVATKSRSSLTERDFRWNGDANAALLFGAHLYKKGYNAILFCEGETDTLAAAELLNGSQIGGSRILPVGISKGAQSAQSIIKQSLEWLVGKFDKFYVCFDNDKPGQEAADAAIEVLPMGKTYRVNLPTFTKDIGQLLVDQENAARLFSNALFNAQQVVPSVFADPDELVEEVLERYYDSKKRWGVSTGYTSLDHLIGGWSAGALQVIMGGTGTGKSNFALQLAYNAASREAPPLLISLEMSNYETAMRLAAFELRDPSVNYPDATLRDKKEMREVLRSIAKRFKFYKSFGSLELKALLSYIEVCVDAYGTRLVVLDHIGFAVPSGEWKDYGIYMKALKSLAVRKGISIIVVAHVSAKENAKEGGATQLSLTDIRASKDIIQDADSVWGLERARDSNTMLLRTLKVSRSAGGRYGEIEFEFVDGMYKEKGEYDGGGTAYEKQLRTDIRQTNSGDDGTQDGVRISDGELHKDVHPGLHRDEELNAPKARKTLLRNRGKGSVLEGGRSKTSSGKTRQSPNENSACISISRQENRREEIPDVSQLGEKERDNGLRNQRASSDTKRSVSVEQQPSQKKKQQQHSLSAPTRKTLGDSPTRKTMSDYLNLNKGSSTKSKNPKDDDALWKVTPEEEKEGITQEIMDRARRLL